MKLVLFMLLLHGVHKTGENTKQEKCETSPVIVGKPFAMIFELEEDHDVTKSYVYIKKRGFNETDFGTDFVLAYEWNRTLDKMEIKDISGDFKFGEIHNKELWLLTKEVSIKYEGIYRIETNYYPDDRTCALNLQADPLQLKVNTRTLFLEVKESPPTDVVFECTALGSSFSPHLLLVDDEKRLVAMHTGIPGKQSVLRYTVRNVRCENSGVYTCEADDGSSVYNSSATLRVLCDMRIQNGLPALNASKGHGELHINITAEESPRTFGFLHIGSDTKGHGSFPKANLFSAECQKTAMPTSACTITASGVTEKDAGYYNVTMATSSQAITTTFHLQYHQGLNQTLDETGVKFIRDKNSSAIYNKQVCLLIQEVYVKYEGLNLIDTKYYQNPNCSQDYELRPQIGSFETECVPILDARKGHGELHINITTTEFPSTFEFQHIGSDSKGKGSLPKADLLSGECNKTAMAKSACTITASGVTEEDAGYYNVTTDTQPSITLTFYLQNHQEPFVTERDTEEAEHNDCTVDIAIAVAATIAICVLVTVVPGIILLKKGILLYKGRSPRPPPGNSEENEGMTDRDPKQPEERIPMASPAT